jgi:hypothetical protein
MKRLSALAPSDSAAFKLTEVPEARFIETQQNQGVCQILAQSRKN